MQKPDWHDFKKEDIKCFKTMHKYKFDNFKRH